MRMNMFLRVGAARLILAAGLLVLITGCNNTVLPKANSLGSINDNQRMLSINAEGTLTFRRIDMIPYVAVRDLCRLLELRMRWDAATGKVAIGDEDTVYVLQVGTANAWVRGTATLLPAPPIVSNAEVLIPVTSLGSLFRDEFRYDVTENGIRLYPKAAAEALSVNDIAFAEEPENSAAAGKNEHTVGGKQSSQRNDLIQTAKRYMDVRYEFAAAPYPESGAFDSSSFIQYIYERYDIHLHRTAQQQSEQGSTVLPGHLRKGDLLFFTVPGYYKSKQIGHVGIYAGDKSMIHVTTDRGVVMTKLDTDIWKHRFVKAQRVLP